jgi:DNA processing protein
MTTSLSHEELSAWLRLTLTHGVGDGTGRKLLAAFGLPQAIFAQSKDALTQLCTDKQAAALRNQPRDFDAQLQATLDWLAGGSADGGQRQIVTLGDALYPPALLAIEDPPLMLYVQGAQETWAQIASKTIAHDIAIVGSRNPTPQGDTNARQFARSLAEAGLHVVSGLALGVDGAAHDGALSAQGSGCGSTIAVVGTGLDRVYPKRHYELAHRIAQRGVIVSEFAIGTPPLAENFPQRNRIIAALTQGTLVVEAALQSGSLITARMASEQGKEVFAIPGSIHSPMSKGCHHLIKQGAKLVESAQDVLEELKHPVAINSIAAHARGSSAFSQNDSENEGEEDVQEAERDLLKAMGHDPVSLDALMARTGIDAAHLQARLMALELDGQVARLPGGLFARQMNA